MSFSHILGYDLIKHVSYYHRSLVLFYANCVVQRHILRFQPKRCAVGASNWEAGEAVTESEHCDEAKKKFNWTMELVIALWQRHKRIYDVSLHLNMRLWLKAAYLSTSLLLRISTRCNMGNNLRKI